MTGGTTKHIIRVANVDYPCIRAIGIECGAFLQEVRLNGTSSTGLDFTSSCIQKDICMHHTLCMSAIRERAYAWRSLPMLKVGVK